MAKVTDNFHQTNK